MAAHSKTLIDPDMTVLDTIYAYAETQTVFKKCDAAAGECICCCSLFLPIRSVADRYHLDLTLLLSELEAAAKS
ncbi:hypothetical protein [Desulfobacula sp.]